MSGGTDTDCRRMTLSIFVSRISRLDSRRRGTLSSACRPLCGRTSPQQTVGQRDRSIDQARASSDRAPADDTHARPMTSRTKKGQGMLPIPSFKAKKAGSEEWPATYRARANCLCASTKPAAAHGRSPDPKERARARFRSPPVRRRRSLGRFLRGLQQSWARELPLHSIWQIPNLSPRPGVNVAAG